MRMRIGFLAASLAVGAAMYLVSAAHSHADVVMDKSVGASDGVVFRIVIPKQAPLRWGGGPVEPRAAGQSSMEDAGREIRYYFDRFGGMFQRQTESRDGRTLHLIVAP